MNTFVQRLFSVFLLLQALTQVQGYLSTSPSTSSKASRKTQLSAWSLPSPGTSFKSTWYQDCPNPTARRIVYEDYDDYDSIQFSYSSFGGDWSSSTAFWSSDTRDSSPEPQRQPVTRRGTRIVNVGRRALQGLRNTLRP